MNSFNHYALGSIGAWLYRDVAGIAQAPESVGFRELVLRPRIGGGLTWAEASYESVRGRIATRWELVDGELRLDVEVPPTATAAVHVPKAGGEETIHRVGSGRYRFRSQMDKTAPVQET
jgi:alpha-L-rhamnosidase